MTNRESLFEKGRFYNLLDKGDVVAYVGRQEDGKEKFVRINGLKDQPIGIGLVTLLASNQFNCYEKDIALVGDNHLYVKMKLTREELEMLRTACIELKNFLKDLFQQGGELA